MAFFAIFRRLKNRENIFKAHRSHLYQRLVISGQSHLTVTLVYGSLAAVGGLLAFGIASGMANALVVATVTVAVLFFGMWRWTVRCEARPRNVERTAVS